MRFCPYCGGSLNTGGVFSGIEPTRQPQSTIAIQQTEPTYYSDEKGVRVTKTRLIIGNATYAMAHITSIKTAGKPANIIPGIILAIIGVSIILFSITQHNMAMVTVVGVVILILGILWIFLSKPTCMLQITSASAETESLISKEQAYIDQIARAVNEALIHRG